MLLECCRCRARSRRALRADRANGGLARRAVPRRALDPGRGRGRSERRGVLRRRPVRLRVLPPRAPVATAGGRSGRSSPTPPSSSACAAGLCDAVLETTGSAQMLETLGHTNGFVVRLDRRGEWYRYHHLFGQLLRNELERSEPERRARAQCAGDGLVHRARPARGGDRLRTRRRRDEHRRAVWSTLWSCLRTTTAEWRPRRSGSAWFSDDELADYPALAVYGAWFRVLTGRPEEAERWLALADGSTSRDPALRRQRDDRALGCHAASAHDGQRRRTCRRRREPGARPARVRERLDLGRAARSRYRACGCSAKPSARRRTTQLPSKSGLRAAPSKTSSLHTPSSRFSQPVGAPGARPDSHARAAQALVETHSLGEYSTSALANVVSARVALHEGRREDARAALARAHRLRPLLDHGASMADRRGRARARSRPSRTRRGRRRPNRPHRDRARDRAPPRPRRPGRGSTRARATASRRAPGRPARGR